MSIKDLNIGMIGYGFMGRAHSNAYRKVNNFFDLEYRPVLKAVCGRDREKAQQFGVALPNVRRNRVAGAREVAFQELPLNGMLTAAHSVPCLVLERPDGIRVRIEGQLPDADYVGKLAACLSR